MEKKEIGTVYQLVGEKIRNARLLKGMTQKSLGDKVDLDRASIALIEKGKQRVSLETLYQIAHTFEEKIRSFLPEMEEIPEFNPAANEIRFDSSQIRVDALHLNEAIKVVQLNRDAKRRERQ